MIRLLLLLLLAAAPLGGAKKRKVLRDMPDPDLLSDQALVHELNELIEADKKSARRWACPRPGCDGKPHRGWLHRHARASQRMPEWFWTTWLMMTGRGWGKTRTAAEAVKVWAKEPNQFIAVVAKNDTLVREICFEHRKSGLLAVLDPEDVAHYGKSAGAVHIMMKNGTYIRGFSGEVPDNLRGWAFDKAWCDEYAAWARKTAQEAYNMIWFCLREAAHPQVIVSTTPKPLPHVKHLVERHRKQVARIQEAMDAMVDQAEAHANGEEVPEGPRVAMTTGHMRENLENLSDVAFDQLEEDYADTRLGDQELAGVLLEDVEGALWQQWMFDVQGFYVDPVQVPELDRKVIAVDPAVTSTDTADESGIAIAGRSPWRSTTYADARPRGYLFWTDVMRGTPLQTMTRVSKLYHEHDCQVAVFEGNNGGEYLITVMNMVDPTVNCRLVWAAKDKRARNTPVASLYEQSRVHHVIDRSRKDIHGKPVDESKQFDRIETLMTSYVGAPESQEKSPDELDAVTWAFTDLFLDPTTVAPRPEKPGQGDQRLEGRR